MTEKLLAAYMLNGRSWAFAAQYCVGCHVSTIGADAESIRRYSLEVSALSKLFQLVFGCSVGMPYEVLPKLEVKAHIGIRERWVNM